MGVLLEEPVELTCREFRERFTDFMLDGMAGTYRFAFLFEECQGCFEYAHQLGQRCLQTGPHGKAAQAELWRIIELLPDREIAEYEADFYEQLEHEGWSDAGDRMYEAAYDL